MHQSQEEITLGTQVLTNTTYQPLPAVISKIESHCKCSNVWPDAGFLLLVNYNKKQFFPPARELSQSRDNKVVENRYIQPKIIYAKWKSDPAPRFLAGEEDTPLCHSSHQAQRIMPNHHSQLQVQVNA